MNKEAMKVKKPALYQQYKMESIGAVIATVPAETAPKPKTARKTKAKEV